MVVPPAMAFIEKSGNNEDGAQNIQLAGGDDADRAGENEQKLGSAKKIVSAEVPWSWDSEMRSP